MLNQTKTVAWLAIGIMIVVSYLAYDVYTKKNPAV